MKYIVIAVLVLISSAIGCKYYKFSKFNSSNTYCPANYELVHGDGTFTHDYSRPLQLHKINVTEKEDWYIYDDKGNAFFFHDCITKEGE